VTDVAASIVSVLNDFLTSVFNVGQDGGMFDLKEWVCLMNVFKLVREYHHLAGTYHPKEGRDGWI